MSDDHTRPFEGLNRWLGDEADASPSMPTADPADREERSGAARRAFRGGALLLPWLLAAVVVVTATAGPPGAPAPEARTAAGGPGGGSARTDAPRADGATARPPGAPDATASDETGAAQPPGAADAGARPAGTAPPGAEVGADALLGATAVGLVRDTVTGRRGGRTSALDVAVPEPPRPLAGDEWLVRVHVVVLRGDARRWRSATHEVWAVPLGVVDGRPVGRDRPWRVDAGTPRVDAGRWTPATVDEHAVRAAVRATGARPATDLAAEQHPTAAEIVRVRVTGAGPARRVWLRTDPGVAVLGARS